MTLYDEYRKAYPINPEPSEFKDIIEAEVCQALEWVSNRSNTTQPEKEEEVKELREWTAWLVEGTDENGSPRYRYADEIGMFEWTTDPLKALHFCRKEDAEGFARGDEDAWRITEHLFTSGDRPARPEVEKVVDELLDGMESIELSRSRLLALLAPVVPSGKCPVCGCSEWITTSLYGTECIHCLHKKEA